MKKIKQYILVGTVASTLLAGTVASAAGSSPLWLRNYLNGRTTPAQSAYETSAPAPSIKPTPTPTPAPTPTPIPAPTPTPTPNPAPAPVTTTPGTVANLTAEEQTLFRLLNENRVSRGLQPLKINASLTELARIKSKDMADNNYFSHTSPTYGKAGDMVRKAGIGARMVGENIAITSSAERANTLFMGSSVHRSAMLNRNYTEVGIGMYRKSNGSLYVTEIFMQSY